VGVKRVVRIMDNDPQMESHLKKIYTNEADCQMSAAMTIEDAEAILDRSRQFLKA
jgi:hypothetical protein